MEKILEIGCGQGFYTSVLSRKNDAIGIDLSRKNISVAKKRYPKVKFLYMNAEKLTFKNNSFDKVYAFEILEHVDNLKNVLKEVSRVLKRGGRFFISVPFYKSEYLLLRLRPTYFSEIHHVRIFREKELEKLCENYKLDICKKKRKGFLQHVELFFLFLRKNTKKSQVSIGSWRDTYYTKLLHVAMLYFDPTVLNTQLKYFPIWLLTLPIAFLVNFIGNIFFPKTLYYEFIKK